MITVIAATTLASIVSGLILSSVVEKIGDRIERNRGALDRLYAAQCAWAEAADADELNAIAYLHMCDRNRAA